MLAAQRGLNPAQLSVCHSANNINPRTGQREFDDLEEIVVIGTGTPERLNPIIMRPAIDGLWGGESGESNFEQKTAYDADIARLDQILGNPETATNADLAWALSFAQALAAHHRNLQSMFDKSGGKMTGTVNGRSVNVNQHVADTNQDTAEKLSTEIRNRLTNGTWTGPVPQLELEKVQVTSPNTFAEDWARTYDPYFSYFPQYDIDPEINKNQICTQYDRTDLSNYFESFNSLDDQIYTYENRLQELEYLSSQASDPTEKANLNQQISGLGVIVGQARGALSILDAKILSLTQKCNSNA